MATAAERKRQERERMRAKGYTLRQYWVHKSDLPRSDIFHERLNKRREKTSK